MDRLSLVAVLLILIVPVEAAAAPDEAALPAGATVLHLAERAERMLPRDEIVAVLSAEATGKTARDVQAEVNRRMAAALDGAKKAAAVKVETPSMSVYATRDPKTGTMWTARESLELDSKDFAQTLALIGTLEGQGLAATSVTFVVSQEALDGVKDALIAEALHRIRAHAGTVAAELGLAVDHIRTVTVGQAAPPGPRPEMLLQAREMPPPAVAPGEAPASLVVNAEIVLLPKP